jgi:L-ascorbate metabolism protein UlaG (beta-lactamase superfamily)
VLLTTHAHRDHFDPAALARYLGRNSEALAVAPSDADGRLDSVAPAARDRTRGVAPTGAQPTTVDLGWVKVQALAIPHGPTPRQVQHVAFLVTLDGTAVLHLGDTQSDPATWPGLGLPARGVDIALVPYWYALHEEPFRALLQVTRARRIVLLHLPVESAAARPLRNDLRDRYPQVEIPAAAGVELAPHR